MWNAAHLLFQRGRVKYFEEGMSVFYLSLLISTLIGVLSPSPPPLILTPCTAALKAVQVLIFVQGAEACPGNTAANVQCYSQTLHWFYVSGGLCILSVHGIKLQKSGPDLYAWMLVGLEKSRLVCLCAWEKTQLACLEAAATKMNHWACVRLALGSKFYANLGQIGQSHNNGHAPGAAVWANLSERKPIHSDLAKLWTWRARPEIKDMPKLQNSSPNTYMSKDFRPFWRWPTVLHLLGACLVRGRWLVTPGTCPPCPSTHSFLASSSRLWCMVCTSLGVAKAHGISPKKPSALVCASLERSKHMGSHLQSNQHSCGCEPGSDHNTLSLV